MVVHLVSPDGSLDQLFTSNYALLQIRDELARLDGVGDINVFGAREYSMRIWLDPHQLSARGLTAQDVVTAIQEQNVQVAAGIIGAPPVPKGATAFQYTVSTQGRLTDEKQFGDIIVKTGANGQVTRCATSRGLSSPLAITRSTAGSVENRPLRLRFSSSRARTRSPLQMRCARKWLSSSNVSPAAGLHIVYDPTVSVRESIHEVQKTLFEAIALVVLSS
jgi:Cation/multidrug efflux pump